mgnify:CR=1 FL=1
MKKGRCRIKTTDPVGMRIKALIDERCDMHELITRLGATYFTVYRWIKGECRPEAENLQLLAGILQTTPEALLATEAADVLTLDQIANMAVTTYIGTQWSSYGKLKCYIDTHGGQLPPRPKRKGGQCEKA